MASLSSAEFERAISLLGNEVGFERLKERLIRRGAFTSRRGLGSTKALADRLYSLSGGLRREVAASYAFQSMWGEVFRSRVGEKDDEALEKTADRINACLVDGKAIDPEKVTTLDEELGIYHRTLAGALGDEVASLDMLLKAVSGVADRIRSWA